MAVGENHAAQNAAIINRLVVVVRREKGVKARRHLKENQFILLNQQYLYNFKDKNG